MLCAHTVRRLKPGTFEQFAEAFIPREEDAPPGWVRFHLLRGLADENEVVTFGFFDGTLAELERSQDEADFQSRRDAIDPFVDAVVTNGVYEIVESRIIESAAKE
jgi:heme-degrading monooxygenase HmoA